MYAQTLVEDRTRSSDTEMARNTSSLASRIPRRSLRQVYGIPLSGDDNSPSCDDRTSLLWCRDARNGSRRIRDDFLQLDVAAIPSADRTCRHHLFVENGARLRKLDLPSTACVVVSQQFAAHAGDTLSYDCVAILYSTNCLAGDRPAIRTVLVNRGTESAVSLMDRSPEACRASRERRASSHFRESQSYTIPTTGRYELKFITFVDYRCPGSEAHLLVNSAHVVSPFGQEVKRLASLSCVGRVQ